MIRRAKIEEILEILVLTNACAQHMIEGGIAQWNEYYPSEQAFIQDMARDELYLFEDYGRITGVIAITAVIDEEYLPVQWLTQAGANLYFCRLAIHPEFQGRGNGQKPMSFAEVLASEKQYGLVWLDTISKNYRNQRSYEQRGSVRLGGVFSPRQSESPFHGYELIL